jgi:hypothetical protein
VGAVFNREIFCPPFLAQSYSRHWVFTRGFKPTDLKNRLADFHFQFFHSSDITFLNKNRISSSPTLRKPTSSIRVPIESVA